MGFGTYETEKSADSNNGCVLDNSENKSALMYTKFDCSEKHRNLKKIFN